MPKILLAGQDVRLLETRAAVLKKTGAEIAYCTASHALKVVVSEMPDLLVLCHSLLHEEAEAIADGVHLFCPMTRVLLVVSQVIADRPYHDAKFDATCLPEPAHLIRCATEFLQGPPHHQARKITRDIPAPVAH
jgi:hypothetical protein